MDDSASAVVIIGDRYPEDPVAEDVRVSTVTVKTALSPNVALRSYGRSGRSLSDVSDT